MQHKYSLYSLTSIARSLSICVQDARVRVHALVSSVHVAAVPFSAMALVGCHSD